jgi:hypothetical protein
LASPDSTRQLAEWSDEVDLETVKCPAHPGHQRAGKRLTDLSVVLPKATMDDFVWTWMSDCLIKESVIENLKRAGCTGFQTRPVKLTVKGAPRAKLPIYRELVVTGWGGEAGSESGIKLITRCPGCAHEHYSGFDDPRKLVDKSQWDGSDFFIIWPMPKYIFITEKVARLIEKEGWIGACIYPVEKLKPCKGFSPGLLSYWMPEERAKKLRPEEGSTTT